MKIPQPILSYVAKVALRTPPIGKPIFRTALNVLKMPLTSHFVDYVIDFERAYKNDDWTHVEAYFSPDAVYEVRNTNFDCRLQGPKNIVKGFKRSLDGFDRKLKRTIEVIEGPNEHDDKVTFVWVGRYESPKLRPLSAEYPDVVVVSARQTAHYQDGLITMLIDDHLPGNKERYTTLLKSYGHIFNPAYEE